MTEPKTAPPATSLAEPARLGERPAPFSRYTAEALWTDDHTSARMLAFHLDATGDIASRNAAFIDRSVAWIVSRFAVGPHTAIADFGCGPGLYAQRLARCGARVTGIDFSARSLAHAREAAAREGLAIRYLQRNYLDFHTADRFDLGLLIMCDFCALGPAQRHTLLRTFHRVLRPGGSVLLDVYSLAAFAERQEAAIREPQLLDGFWSPHRYDGVLNTVKYHREKVVLDRYTIVEAERTRTVYNWLQYFSPETLAEECARAGFAVEALFADVAGAPYNPAGHEFAVIARKKKSGTAVR